MTAFPVVFKTEEDLEECTFCQRRFAPNRIGIHEGICGKSSSIVKRESSVTEQLENIYDDTEVSGSRMLMTNWRHRRERLLKEIKSRKNSQTTKEKSPIFFDCDMDDTECYTPKKTHRNIDV